MRCSFYLSPYYLQPSSVFRQASSIQNPASRIEYQVSSIPAVPINLLNQTTQSTNQLSDMPRHDYSSLWSPDLRTCIFPLQNHNEARTDILAAVESTGVVRREYSSAFSSPPSGWGRPLSGPDCKGVVVSDTWIRCHPARQFCRHT